MSPSGSVMAVWPVLGVHEENRRLDGHSSSAQPPIFGFSFGRLRSSLAVVRIACGGGQSLGTAPFPSEMPPEVDWTRLPVRADDEVVRVVWHGGTEAIWLDPVFDKGTPDIHLVTAGQVARWRLGRLRCRLLGHRPGVASILEGSPLDDTADPAAASRIPMTLALEQTDGKTDSFVLEMCDRVVCRTCGLVDRRDVDRGPSMWRLHRTGYPLPPRPDAPWWLRARLPWNPWGPMRGLYASAITPIAFAGLIVLLPFRDIFEPPAWLIMMLTIGMVADIAFSTCLGYLREFLEACGARFDRPHPFGRRPGNASLWTIRPAEALSPRARTRRETPQATSNSDQAVDTGSHDQTGPTEAS